MMKLNIFGFIILLLACCTSAFAASNAIRCPSVTAIQKIGFNDADTDPHHPQLWAWAQKNNRYDTHQNWSFLVLVSHAKTKQESYQKALTALATLKPAKQAKKTHKLGLWVCHYQNASHFSAIAVTPPIRIGDL